jgi:hypothetical protein
MLRRARASGKRAGRDSGGENALGTPAGSDSENGVRTPAGGGENDM